MENQSDRKQWRNAYNSFVDGTEENEKVSNIDERVFQEVLKSEKLEEIKEIYNDIEKNVFIEKLPEEEKKYILVNLLLIKENK